MVGMVSPFISELESMKKSDGGRKRTVLCDVSTGGRDTPLSCQRWRMYGVVLDGFVACPKMYNDGWG